MMLGKLDSRITKKEIGSLFVLRATKINSKMKDLSIRSKTIDNLEDLVHNSSLLVLAMNFLFDIKNEENKSKIKLSL